MNANVIHKLNQLLADSIVLNMKLHHFHWRVEGPGFYQLHAKFEELYNHFGNLQDELAERILMVGGAPHASLKQSLGQSRIQEMEEVPAARDMILILQKDLSSYRDFVLEAINEAEEAGDRGSVSLLDPVVDALDKELWMLGAYLAQ